MTLASIGFMGTTFATSAEPTTPTFCLKSATLNGLETQPNLLETSLRGDTKYAKSANGKHLYWINDCSYSYCYWYDFPGPTGDRVDVMLPTYGYDNSKVEWDGNMYPEHYSEDYPNLKCTGVSTKRINNTAYTIYSFKTNTTKFPVLQFNYRGNGPNPKYFTFDGGQLVKFSVDIMPIII